MSTKIEDLSDSEYEEEYEEEQDDEIVQEKPHIESFDQDINSRIMNILIEKVKHPILVTGLFLVLTHPILIKGIFRIPYIEVADSTIGVNVILSILAGILFFIFREFI